MWFKKEKNQEDLLTEQTIKELEKLKQEEINKDSLKNLNKIFRIFLKEKYKTSQGLTPEEVILALKGKSIDEQIKLNISAIIQEIYKEEYAPRIPLTRKQFDNYIEQTKKLIISTDETLTHSH